MTLPSIKVQEDLYLDYAVNKHDEGVILDHDHVFITVSFSQNVSFGMVHYHLTNILSLALWN